MRTRWIASLVSLSLASGHGVCAQEALWFAPSQPTVVAPEATAKELSFSQRFGGLLSQPGHTSQPAARPVGATHSGAAASSHGESAVPAAAARDGGRPLEIPWSVTASAPFPSAQELGQTSPAPDTPARQAIRPGTPGRGAQVAPLAPQVKPNYVQTSAQTSTQDKSAEKPATSPAMSLGVVDRIPWQTHVSRPAVASAPPALAAASKSLTTAPAESNTHPPAETLLPPAAVAVVDNPPQLPMNAPKVQSAAQGPTRASILPNPPAPVAAAVAQKPVPQPKSLNPSELDRLLADSLIQPVPQEKLNPALLALPPQVELPSAVASVSKTASQPAARPVAKLNDKPKAVPALLTSSPLYTYVDDQPSASDRAPATVVPAPAVTNRLTDKLESPPAFQQGPQILTPAKLPPADTDGLLSTQSMIGPLQGAERLFGRLNIREDLRDVADRIESGPRGDTGNFEWMPAAYTWISPAFYHYPLYFEQPNLERYGLGPRPVLKPLASSIHFFGSIPLVPYKTLTHHPRERVYTLGNMRPGDCVPVQRGVILGPSTVGEVTMFWEECSGY